jgi:hypothetical protein
VKKYLYILLSGAFLLGCSARPTRAQDIGNVGLRSFSITVFSSQATAAVTPNSGSPTCVATAGNPCGINNLGLNVHFLTYTCNGCGGNNLTALDIRLEGSIDGVTFVPISDDATDMSQGEVYACGFYPIVRANLVLFTIASGTPTLTASYSGTSGNACPPLGVLNPTQTSRRPIFYNQTANANHSTTNNIVTPFGSTLGYIVLQTSAAGSLPGGSTLSLQLNLGAGANQSVLLSIPTAQQASTTWIPVNAIPASTIGVTYTSGGASALTFNAYYLFMSPSLPNGLLSAGVQPVNTLNSETTSAANTPIALLLQAFAGIATDRVHLYSVSARCSAGTASLSVKDGATTIWSTAGTEVGATSFKYQWNPPLSSTLANSMTVTLGACGAANTGTLDVQASQF